MQKRNAFHLEKVTNVMPMNVLLHGLIESGLTSPRIESSVILHSAISIKDGNNLHKGDPVMYINREKEFISKRIMHNV